VTDPTGHDPLLRALAYGHPALMLCALGLVGFALRLGLGLRAARRGLETREAARYRRHLRVGKLAVGLVAVGWVGGAVSMFVLRGQTPFGTLHALAASVALVLFAATAWLGRKLERGQSRARETHALLALAAVAAAAAAAGTGIVLLP
jgi:hypothetical protein